MFYLVVCYLLVLRSFLERDALKKRIILGNDYPKLLSCPTKVPNLFGGVGVGQFRAEAVMSVLALKKVVVASVWYM